MLDFYIIHDEQTNPEWPEQTGLVYAGGLDDKIFRNLKNKGFIEDGFHYYDDFRWNSAMVQQKYNFMKEKIMTKTDTDLKVLFEILEQAEKLNQGLIAYAD